MHLKLSRPLKQMKLIYLAIDVDYPGFHGGSTHVGEATDSLVKMCDTVYLVCKWRAGQKLLEKKQNKIIIRVPSINIPVLRMILYFLSSWMIAVFLILSKQVDVVYERARIFGGGGIVAGHLLNRKTIYEIIEPYIIIPVIQGTIKKNSWVEREMVGWHKYIGARASRVTTTHKSAIDGINPNKVLFIHTGANPEKFKPMNADDIRKKYALTREKTLLYIGSFTEWHACEAMIKATAQMVKKDKKVKLMMIGHGQQYNLSIRLAERLGVLGNVIFVGKISMEQVPKYINAADVCFALFDRRYPPFKKLGYYYSPIKIHEYKACAKAIIASRYPQIKELVKQNVNGLLVDETKVDEVTKAVKILLRNPKLAQKMGKKNREEVEKIYNWDYFNEKILEN